MTITEEAVEATYVPRGSWAGVAKIYWFIVAFVGTITFLYSCYNSMTFAGNGGALNGLWFTLSYFTVWSNIVIMISNWMLFGNPARDGSGFRWFRMTGLVMITITGLVYAIVLAPLSKPVGPDVWTNFGYHYFVPWATVLGFLLFGPRPRFNVKQVFTMLLIPVIWLAYTLLRGLLLLRAPAVRPSTVVGDPQHWYPYPFIDVSDPEPLVPGVALTGYAGVGVNIIAIVVLGIIFGFIFLGLDRALSGGRKPVALD